MISGHHVFFPLKLYMFALEEKVSLFLFPAVISLVMCTGQPVAPAPSFRLCSVNPSRSGLERIRKNFDLGGI